LLIIFIKNGGGIGYIGHSYYFPHYRDEIDIIREVVQIAHITHILMHGANHGEWMFSCMVIGYMVADAICGCRY
jgi:hypothetical protein